MSKEQKNATEQEPTPLRRRKPRNFWKTVRRLIRYLSSRSIAIISVFILAIGAVIFQIQTPKVLGQATTEIFEGVMAGVKQMQAGEQVNTLPIDFDAIGRILLVVIAMYLTSAVFNFLQQFIMTRVSQRSVYQMRRDLDQKMDRLPMSYFDTH
ncbi:MAG: ABC transporter ATP-binding protein, partial [Tetragenococcus halophilus]|nr:ABC transporter ATP-binding protein [Tetragenococcus halophilus]MDN6264896.1 ABC transporter ATP-binding protein [Tetragenococcus halophilus]